MTESSVVEATRAYERWLAMQVHVVRADLERKHRLMTRDAFTFLRATYYRFAARFSVLCPELATTPPVAAVGDLHLENFGTWRDAEGRLVWGVNDYDEADVLPYTIDLVRLTASALLALDEGYLPVKRSAVAGTVLAGYRRGLVDGTAPAVLAERRRWLAGAVAPALPDPRGFWERLAALPAARSRPAAARAALRAAAPGRGWRPEWHIRVAGVGSLGKPRLVALGEWQGSLVARELKASAAPASRLVGSAAAASRPRVRYDDPGALELDGWLVRRLSPDKVKLDLAGLDRKRLDLRLLSAMGRETARVHLRTRNARERVAADLDARPPRWLADAAALLARDTQADFRAWRGEAD